MRCDDAVACRLHRIDHAAALLTDGENRAAVKNWVCGVHQGVFQEAVEALAAERQRAVCQRVLQGLENERRAACDIGRCHGRAAHDLVVRTLRKRADAAAGRGDLGLDVQCGRGAPRGEGGDVAAAGRVRDNRVVQAAEADRRTGGRKLLELCAGVAADQNGGIELRVFCKHVAHDLVGCFVIIDDHGFCTQHGGVHDLGAKGNVLAALYQRDERAFGRVAEQRHDVRHQVAVAAVHELHLADRGPVGTVANGEVGGCARIDLLLATENVKGGGAVKGVVHGRHAQRTGIDARAGDGAGIDDAPVIGVVVCILVGGGKAVVAGCDAGQNAVLLCGCQCLLQIFHIVVEARGAAKAEVDDVRAQLDRVLDRADDVIDRAAQTVRGEHLQRKDLRIRGNALDAAVFLVAVRGHNAGDVRAVRVGVVFNAVFGDIAVSEGNLVGVICAVAQLCDLRFHLGLRVLELRALAHLHVGMLVVDAAVDDRDCDALAGVAAVFGLPQLHDRGHILRRGHIGGKRRDLADGHNAVEFGDLRHLRAFHANGERTDQIGRLIDDLIAGDTLDLTDHALLRPQGLRFGRLRGKGVGRVAGLFHRRGRVRDNQRTDDLVGVLFLDCLHLLLPEILGGTLQIIRTSFRRGCKRLHAQRQQQRQNQA